MSSLTQTSISARKTIRYVILFIIFLTIGRILLTAGIAIYLRVFPPKPTPPTVIFGKLTKVPFPQKSNEAKLNFILETATGELPKNIPIQAKVYFMPKVNANLLSLENSKIIAQRMGFNDVNPVAETETLYRFKNPASPGILKINIVTGTFSIGYDLAADKTPIQSRPPAAELAASKFRGFLAGANVLPKDFKEGPMVPSYFKLSSGSLVRVLALSEADVTKVSLFRQPYDKLPSLTANPRQSNVWGIITGSNQREQQVIASEYHYFPVDETKFGTYPVIPPEAAFEELKKGNSYVASMGQYKNGDSLKIRKVYLAYYDPDVPSDFYQPIYVFESGDNDPENSFIGYVPAISPEYYSSN